MTKRALAIAALNIIVVFNSSLLAQQPTIGTQFSAQPARPQHSILERIGPPETPKPPAERVAMNPVQTVPTQPATVSGPSSLKVNKNVTRVPKKLPKENSEQDQRIEKLADYDDPTVVAADRNQSRESFAIQFTGPKRIEPGSLQVFRFKVTNMQPVPSEPAAIELATPSGIVFVDSTAQAQVDLSQKTVKWFVQSLEPGATVEANFRIRGTQPGTKLQRLSVVQNANVIQNQTFESFVLNQQSVKTEIFTNNESVPVGHPSQIEVALTNLTQNPQHDLQVQVELPSGVRVVDSVLYDVEENRVTFQPIDINGNQTRRVSLTLVANEAGAAQMSAVVVSQSHAISNKEQAVLRFNRIATRRSNGLTKQR